MMATSYDVDLQKIDASSAKDSIKRLTNVSVSLQTVIDAYEKETLPDQSDPVLEKARNVLETAMNQIRYDQPDQTEALSVLETIDKRITNILSVRYGCND